MGEHGETTINNNGRRLIDFCIMNIFVIGNTFFEHKDIHQYTRIGPKGEKSIIDYILIERNKLRMLNDVRVKRGPEIYSDHFLVVGKVKVQVEIRNGKQEDSRYEKIKSYKLKEEEIATQYQEKVTNLIENRSDIKIDSDVDTAWNTFKVVILKAETETCGIIKKRGNKKQTAWWNDTVKSEVAEKKKR